MSDRKNRVFKLGFPFELKRKGSGFFIIGSHSDTEPVKIDKIESIKVKSIDSDGFVLFEVKYLESPKLQAKVELPQVVAGINGYTLVHSSVPKAVSYGTIKSIYEYYKRDSDLSYYVLIKREGFVTRKFLLGGLLEYGSRLYQAMQIIDRNFAHIQAFDRKLLSEVFPSPLKHRRLMKCILDVLTFEKLLVMKEVTTKKGRKKETFIKTEKLEQLRVSPRLNKKPNGLSVGQLPLTSD